MLHTPTQATLKFLAAGLPIAMLGCASVAQADLQPDSVSSNTRRSSSSYGVSNYQPRPNPYLTANCTSWETDGSLTSNETASVEDFQTTQNPANAMAQQSPPETSAETLATRPAVVAHPTNAASNLNMTMYGVVPGNSFSTENSFDPSDANTTNVRRVTFADVGADFDPDVTRDGNSVVFASTQHRPTADIYIKDVFSRTVTRLTSDPAQDVMPAVSPDGEYVAFSSDREGTWDLYMMPTTGGNPVRLTNESTHDLHPSWSPDGTRLTFSRFGEVSNRWEMWVMDISSPAGLQFIGYGLFPEWCPVSGTGMDGADRIAFQRSRERGDRSFSVWTIEYSDRNGASGRETEVVSSTSEALINPSWSPDGEFLLYASVSNDSGNPETATGPEHSSLWMIGADGRGAVQFVRGTTLDLMPTWGPNNHVFFVSNRSGSENLWAIEVGRSVQTANAQRLGSAVNPYASAETEPTGFDEGN